jgi:hypothetical protein
MHLRGLSESTLGASNRASSCALRAQIPTKKTASRLSIQASFPTRTAVRKKSKKENEPLRRAFTACTRGPSCAVLSKPCFEPALVFFPNPSPGPAAAGPAPPCLALLHFTEMCSGSEAGSYLKAHRPCTSLKSRLESNKPPRRALLYFTRTHHRTSQWCRAHSAFPGASRPVSI